MLRLHLTLAAIWAVLIIPTWIWWHDSVLWVAFCSLYANAGLHIGAYQGARAESAAKGSSGGGSR
jgi:hypothetical protein